LKPENFAAVDQKDSVGSVLRILSETGLKGKLVGQVESRSLAGFAQACPLMAIMKDGSWVVVVNITDDPNRKAVTILDPRKETDGQTSMSLQSFKAAWSGTLILCQRGSPARDEMPSFGFGWFMPEILRHRRYLRDVAIAATMSSLIAFSTPLMFQVLIDKVITHHSYQTMTAVISILVVLMLFDGVFNYMRQYLMLFVTSKIDAQLASRTFRHLLRLPLAFFEATTAGVLTKHLQQTDTIRHFLTGRLFLTLLDAIALPLTLALLLCYSVKLTLIVLLFSTAIALVIAVMVPTFRHQLERLYQAEGARQAHLVETIHGMRTVKSLAIEPMRLSVWNEAVALGIERRANVGRIAAIANVLTQVLEKGMQICILGLGAVDVFDGSLSIGALVAFNMVSGRVTGPLVQIVSLTNEYQEAGLAVQMLGIVMRHPQERDPGRAAMSPEITGMLEFDKVTFRYDASMAPALDRVSFTIPQGQVIGIVGRSGSGKTTLTRLIQGVQAAQEGVIRLNGFDIRNIDLVHLRRSIGVVLQENFLFRGTIRDNIAAARPSASLDEVIAAARMAGADEFIDRLPRSYQTMIEENGANFSGGQRQRIAIARVLLTCPRLLIFDEATSALDPESEAIVQDHLSEIAEGRTVIIVSHRMTSLTQANAILVLEQGKILDYAPHGVLLERCETYRRLWHQQTNGFK
jgi:ATP-binding cassette subfamily B protein